jgi:uncharacterized protein
VVERRPTAGTSFHRLLVVERGAWWRLLVAVVLGIAGLVVTSTACAIVVLLVARHVGYPDFDFDIHNGIDAGEMLATNLGLACLIGVAAGLARLLYRVRMPGLSSTRPGLRWDWLGRCVGLAAVVWAPLLVLGTASAYASRNASVDGAVLAFIGVVIVTTPLQAAGEEYLFRGLLLQSLGATRLPSSLCCLGSGALFATAHLQFAPPLFADRLVLGTVLAWLAIRTGGLEGGIAIHAVKNISVLIPAGLLDSVSAALEPRGVTWVPLAVDAVLLSIVVPWMVVHADRRCRAESAAIASPVQPGNPVGGSGQP